MTPGGVQPTLSNCLSQILFCSFSLLQEPKRSAQISVDDLLKPREMSTGVTRKSSLVD